MPCFIFWCFIFLVEQWEKSPWLSFCCSFHQRNILLWRVGLKKKLNSMQEKVPVFSILNCSSTGQQSIIIQQFIWFIKDFFQFKRPSQYFLNRLRSFLEKGKNSKRAKINDLMVGQLVLLHPLKETLDYFRWKFIPIFTLLMTYWGIKKELKFVSMWLNEACSFFPLPEQM